MDDVTRPPITKAQVKNAGAVGGNVRLAEVLLRRAAIEWFGVATPDRDISLQLRADYETSWVSDDKFIVATLHAQITGVDGEMQGDARPVLLKVDVAFELVYQLLAAPPAEALNDLFASFAAVNGPLNGWPYVREYFDSTVRRIGVSRGTLPLFRVPRFAPEAPKSPETK